MEKKWELEEIEDEGEALSLSDLPLIHQCSKMDKLESTGSSDCYKFCKGTDENREDFDFCIVPEEMCAADEVFFQGQILPLHRHSNVYPHRSTRPISRSGSVGHSTPGGFSSSSSGSAGRTTHRNVINGRKSSSSSSSSAWNILKLGLVTAPPDIKTRWSSNTHKTNGGGEKKKPRNNSSNNVELSGCKCSSNVAVDGAIVRRSVQLRTTEGTRKTQLSHRRTFEWLKQLSLEDPPPIGAVGSN